MLHKNHIKIDPVNVDVFNGRVTASFNVYIRQYLLDEQAAADLFQYSLNDAFDGRAVALFSPIFGRCQLNLLFL